MLGGETDPTALLTSFARGVSTGLVTGALSGGISAMANMGCKLAKISSMLKMGMAGIGFLGSAYATLESVEDGNAQQAGFRFILTAVSGIGFKRAVGEGMTTINSNCFIAGTLVLTKSGNKPIEEIQVGDKVLAKNPETGEQEYKEVVQTFENETNELVYLTVNSEEIVTTPKHPFYVPQRGWINAIDLKAGDILVLSNGEYVTVEQIQHEILENPVKIYNFEVQDFHTYYVGESSVLVHNMGCGSKTSQTGAETGRKIDFYVTPNGEAIPATGYRYMDSKYASQTMTSMSAPGSYFGFEKFDSDAAAQDAFQIAPEWSNCKLRGEFDTLQVIDGMYVSKEYGDKEPGLEPFTRCYPQYGKGGCQQFIFKDIINFRDVTIIGD